MKHLLRLLLLIVVFAALIGFFAQPVVHAARAPLVLAFYYNWYDENTWKPDRVPDMPVLKYVSRDSQIMAWHIQQARRAGIDAFVVSWWGAGNPTDTNFKTMLTQARAADFRVAIDFELTSPFYHSKDDVVKSLKYLLATYVQHPAYLRVMPRGGMTADDCLEVLRATRGCEEGKPVIFFWRQQMYSVDEWKTIRDAVDPDHRTIWIEEGLDVSYLRVFDGHHLYMVAWAPNAYAELNKWPRRIRAYGADKIWVATVNPGADNRKTTQTETVVRDRENGAYYREVWRAAFSTYPDWIIITSWNEWAEGTMIEPSVTYGNLYLDITREFAAQFKAGLPTPTPAPTRTPTPTATPTTTPPSSSPSPSVASEAATETGVPAMITTDALRVRAEPRADAPVLGRLREGTIVKILGRTEDSKWWQIAYPNEKGRGWIAAEFTTFDIETDAAPTPSATPTNAPTSAQGVLHPPGVVAP